MATDPDWHALRWKTLGVLSLSLVIIGLDTTILNIALPTLATAVEKHAKDSLYARIVTSLRDFVDEDFAWQSATIRD